VEKRRVLAAAVRTGKVIPVALLMGALRDLLQAAQIQTWRLDEKYPQVRAAMIARHRALPALDPAGY
jgi:hypothetical protein